MPLAELVGETSTACVRNITAPPQELQPESFQHGETRAGGEITPRETQAWSEGGGQHVWCNTQIRASVYLNGCLDPSAHEYSDMHMKTVVTASWGALWSRQAFQKKNLAQTPHASARDAFTLSCSIWIANRSSLNVSCNSLSMYAWSWDYASRSLAWRKHESIPFRRRGSNVMQHIIKHIIILNSYFNNCKIALTSHPI